MPNNITPVQILSLGLWGDIKTAKTTLALTAPKPLFHADLDLGLDRAISRFANDHVTQIDHPLSTLLESRTLHDNEIVSRPYLIPMLWPGQSMQGMLTMLNTVVTDVAAAYACPNIKSVIIDTGTVLWTLATNAHLERVQQTNSQRQRLQQIEYARPNSELRTLYSAARTYRKNLIITHHMGGIYKERLTDHGVESVRIGDTWAGFSGMGAIMDIVVRTAISRNDAIPVPMIKIETCGYALALEEQELTNPTFDMLLGIINNLRNMEV